jgi:hypothetical protein
MFYTNVYVFTKGANLVFDCVLRGLELVYSKNGNKPISNLYIQLDNTNYNKGYGLLSALASLIQTGIVKKVFYKQESYRFDCSCLQIKVSYLIVGHTHADVDALIGTIVSHLRNVDQMSPEEFAEAVGEACHSQDGSIDSIQNTMSTPDYESNFGKTRMSSDLDGIQECREIRLTAADNGSDDYVTMHYKVIILYVLFSLRIRF